MRRSLQQVIVGNCTGPANRTFKVIFVGDAGVGKSSFIVRITQNEFVPLLSSTLGVDFNVRSLNVNGNNVAIQLWDTAGQERFRSITKSYFRRVNTGSPLPYSRLILFTLVSGGRSHALVRCFQRAVLSECEEVGQ